MAVCTLQFHGEAIQKASSMNVIFPHNPEFERPFPVLYLLHGLSDDHTIWCRRTSIERYVRELPLMVVMPDSGRGFYTDAVEGMAYEQHIMEDVIGFVERSTAGTAAVPQNGRVCARSGCAPRVTPHRPGGLRRAPA